MGDSDPLAAALRLLTVRDRSEAELAARLLRKGFDEAQITDAVERCRRYGYLDDARFARERARSLLRQGRAVGPRLLADLRQHGVGEAEARAAVDEAREEFDERELLAELLRRRFPDFIFRAAADRERRRVVNYFLRRGFSLPQVLSFFQAEER